MAAMAAAVYSCYLFLLLRYGVLSAIAATFTTNILAATPQSVDLGSWMGSVTAVVVPLLMLLAFAAFRTAVGDQVGLRRYLAGDTPSSSSGSS